PAGLRRVNFIAGLHLAQPEARGAGRSRCMDASPILAHEMRCDVCGYPRRGLDPDALCPECGEPPPRLAGESSPESATTPALSAARLAHLRAITVGLVLLVTSSVTSLSVTLIMGVGSLSVPAMNVPAPKIHGAALVQR